MNEYENVDEGYKAETGSFLALYILAWLLIVKALGKLIRLPQNLTETDYLKKEREVNLEVKGHFADLNKKVVAKVEKQVTEAYVHGVQYARQTLSQENTLIELKDDEIQDIEENLEDSHEKRLRKMITQSQDDLLKATNNTENNIKMLVRKVVSKEMANMGHSKRIGKKSNMALRVEQQLREQFLANGIKNADVAIIDRAKRKWKLNTYSEMVIRTKMNMAYIDAIREEALQDGSDLAIISTKPDTYDACLGYEGMIISLNGLTAGYLTYEQIKASKQCFHPNCGHFVRPVGDIDWIPQDLITIHDKKMAQYHSEN